VFPTKAFSGEVVTFGATVFREGHDLIGADLIAIDPEGAETRHRMVAGIPGTDRWTAQVQLETEGDWSWLVEAYTDDWATWLHAAEIKVPAGLDVEVTFALGSRLLTDAVDEYPDTTLIRDAAKALANPALSPASRLRVATASAAGTSSSPAARVPASRPTAPGRAARSARPPAACPPSPAWASTSCTSRPCTRSERRSARVRTTR
jgi:hypothetical protein